jgi:hypothetical protein
MSGQAKASQSLLKSSIRTLRKPAPLAPHLPNHPIYHLAFIIYNFSKSPLTKISSYDLISYVSQQNSSQGRPGSPAGAGARALGARNSPRAACSRSAALHSVSITQFREGSFSARSATLRENREKGKLVAPCRAVSFLSFASHQYPSANPALKNPSKPPFGTFTNEGQSRSMKANEGE